MGATEVVRTVEAKIRLAALNEWSLFLYTSMRYDAANGCAPQRNGVVPDTTAPFAGELGSTGGLAFVKLATADQVRPKVCQSRAWTRQ